LKKKEGVPVPGEDVRPVGHTNVWGERAKRGKRGKASTKIIGDLVRTGGYEGRQRECCRNHSSGLPDRHGLCEGKLIQHQQLKGYQSLGGGKKGGKESPRGMKGRRSGWKSREMQGLSRSRGGVATERGCKTHRRSTQT